MTPSIPAWPWLRARCPRPSPWPSSGRSRAASSRASCWPAWASLCAGACATARLPRSPPAQTQSLILHGLLFRRLLPSKPTSPPSRTDTWPAACRRPQRRPRALPPEHVAIFSSYASAANLTTDPTADVRFKPDLVAPGYLRSAHSTGGYSGKIDQCSTVSEGAREEGPGLAAGARALAESCHEVKACARARPSLCVQTVMSGTSMSAPLVAGAAALVRQYFTKGYYPSGAVGQGRLLILEALVPAEKRAQSTRARAAPAARFETRTHAAPPPRCTVLTSVQVRRWRLTHTSPRRPCSRPCSSPAPRPCGASAAPMTRRWRRRPTSSRALGGWTCPTCSRSRACRQPGGSCRCGSGLPRWLLAVGPASLPPSFTRPTSFVGLFRPTRQGGANLSACMCHVTALAAHPTTGGGQGVALCRRPPGPVHLHRLQRQRCKRPAAQRRADVARPAALHRQARTATPARWPARGTGWSAQPPALTTEHVACAAHHCSHAGSVGVLVNDLDLSVSGPRTPPRAVQPGAARSPPPPPPPPPSGPTLYWGNGVAGGDRRNNVEKVRAATGAQDQFVKRGGASQVWLLRGWAGATRRCSSRALGLGSGSSRCRRAWCLRWRRRSATPWWWRGRWTRSSRPSSTRPPGDELVLATTRACMHGGHRWPPQQPPGNNLLGHG